MARETQAAAEFELDYRWEVGLAVACGGLLLAAWAAARLGAGALLVVELQLAALIVGAVVPILGTVPGLLRREIDVDFLMLLAAFGAAYLHEIGEGAILMFLFSGSGALEAWTERRTARSIEALKDRLETIAEKLLPNGESLTVPVEELVLGDRILIRPGGRIAADGIVVAGNSEVDQAALTGESLPVARSVGDEVMAGSINLRDGALTIEVRRAAADSTLARMIRLVQEAQRNRARTQRFTDWFGERYTWLVIVGTLAAFGAFQWLGRMTWDAAIYRAMTLLVVASPCALVLATPAAILAAIATAARHGVLVKGGGSFEDIARATVVVFDKTGTLTSGEPRVERIVPLNGVSEDEILRLAASAERHSEHPLGGALLRLADERGVSLTEPDSFQALTGRGISAEVAGQQVLVGSRRLFRDEGYEVPACPSECPHQDAPEGCRALVVGTPAPIGLVDVADAIRPNAAAAVAGLRQAGIRHVVMLTGDSGGAAAAIGQEAGIDRIESGLLPEDKLTRLKSLRAEHGPVIMIGDGVNDAPALATAEVGVAMGGIGSDVALETADVILTADDLSRLPFLVQLSHRTTRIILQNLILAITVIVSLVLTVLFTDQIRLPFAVVAHEGSTVLVILNGLRLLRA